MFNIFKEKTTSGLWMKLEILDEHDLLENTIVQFAHEGRYENN
jgi:hypothetical protein